MIIDNDLLTDEEKLYCEQRLNPLDLYVLLKDELKLNEDYALRVTHSLSNLKRMIKYYDNGYKSLHPITFYGEAIYNPFKEYVKILYKRKNK